MEQRDRAGAGSHISCLPPLEAKSGQPLRVLVIGAGASGISAARGLLRDGHDVTIFDQRADTRAGGGAVTIWSNGETVLRQLGVDMDGAGQLLSSVRVRTSSGRRVATLDVTTMVKRLGAPVRMVPRRVLLERLLTGFPVDRIRCNARAARVITMPDGVAVGFDDGSVVEGDLLIGADGLHSVIRDVVGAPAAEPTGWCSWQGLVNLPEVVDKHVAYIIIGEHGNTGLWPAGDSHVQWWFDLPWSRDFVRPQRPIEVIRSTFAGWSDSVDLVLAKLTDDDLARSPYPHFRHPIPGALNAGPVTLLGDAAHTMPPTLAQGTNQALLDTMVLCQAISSLRATSSRAALSQALRSYEKTRRRQVSAVSRVASLQVAHGEFVLRPAALLSDRLHTWALTQFVRLTSHPRIAAQIDRDRAAALPVGSCPR
jgi:FAD-dependent urate hydroxylase